MAPSTAAVGDTKASQPDCRFAAPPFFGLIGFAPGRGASDRPAAPGLAAPGGAAAVLPSVLTLFLVLTSVLVLASVFVLASVLTLALVLGFALLFFVPSTPPPAPAVSRTVRANAAKIPPDFASLPLAPLGDAPTLA